MPFAGSHLSSVTSIRVSPKIVHSHSYSNNAWCEPYFIHFSSRLYVLIRLSSGLWIVYESVLGFRPSYIIVVKLLLLRCNTCYTELIPIVMWMGDTKIRWDTWHLDVTLRSLWLTLDVQLPFPSRKDKVKPLLKLKATFSRRYKVWLIQTFNRWPFCFRGNRNNYYILWCNWYTYNP